MKTIKIGDLIVQCCTISELAKACNLSTKTIYKHIERGNLPEANIRGSVGNVRLYSKELVATLADVFSKVWQGKKITVEQRLIIVKAFMEEKKRLKL